MQKIKIKSKNRKNIFIIFNIVVLTFAVFLSSNILFDIINRLNKVNEFDEYDINRLVEFDIDLNCEKYILSKNVERTT